jgi:hypothetical protein
MKPNGKPNRHFSFPSTRRLARYLGESDAILEIDELACRFFIDAAGQSEDAQAFVVECSKKFGVCVNLAEFGAWRAHLAQRHIVAVYESAERFFKEFRREHSELHRREWTGDEDGKSRIDLALENLSATKEQSEKTVGLDLISRFEYYRLVRNWIVHDRTRTPEKETAALRNLSEYSDENADTLGRLNAPNLPNLLNFDDFILFSRVTKLVAERFCVLGKPADDSWLSTFDMKPFRALLNNKRRLKNAVSGKLRTDFGMSSEAAEWISTNLCDSLA